MSYFYNTFLFLGSSMNKLLPLLICFLPMFIFGMENRDRIDYSCVLSSLENNEIFDYASVLVCLKFLDEKAHQGNVACSAALWVIKNPDSGVDCAPADSVLETLGFLNKKRKMHHFIHQLILQKEKSFKK